MACWLPCCSKKWPRERATSPPMSGTRLNNGHGRWRISSRSPNHCASALAVLSPTCSMPSANSRRSSVAARLASIAAIRLSAHLVAIFFVFHSKLAGCASACARHAGSLPSSLSTALSTAPLPSAGRCSFSAAASAEGSSASSTSFRCNSWSRLSRYRSATLLTMPASTRVSMYLSPRPSISIARREAKWAMASLRCAGQDSSPEQRHAAAPSSRTISEPTPSSASASARARCPVDGGRG